MSSGSGRELAVHLLTCALYAGVLLIAYGLGGWPLEIGWIAGVAFYFVEIVVNRHDLRPNA